MARGLQEKISFRIRKGQDEELDRIKANDYLDSIKRTKENKDTKFFVREVEFDQYYDFQIVVLEKNDKKSEDEAIIKKFKEHA